MSSMNIALTKLCNRNGLPKITVHSLRHMFATIFKVKLTKLNRGHIQQLYNKEMKVSESAVKLVKNVMNTAMGYAVEKKMILVNPAEGVDLSKQKLLCETYRGTRALYIFSLNCGILLPCALLNCPSSFGLC